MRCFVATGNQGKLREIAPMVRSFLPEYSTPEGRAALKADETEATFLGNAHIKAYALFQELEAEGLKEFAVLADDSGLEVDVLNGEPGVRTARYAGDHVSSAEHIAKLLREVNARTQDPSLRTARYRCALVLLEKKNGAMREWHGEGRCEGWIGFEPVGGTGFGYDPIFMIPGSDKSFAQIPFEDKNSFSHRQRAFESLARHRKERP